MHNFNSQRSNMTNHCVEGGKETDDPFAPNFWAPRVNPGTGLPYAATRSRLTRPRGAST